MSAWLVSREHIDLIVTHLRTTDEMTDQDATGIGDMLWQENARSLRYRYNDADEIWPLPVSGEYRFTPRPTEDIPYVAKQIECYRYQACECPDFDTTPAGILTAAMLQVITAQYGDYSDTHAYVDASWGVDA